MAEEKEIVQRAKDLILDHVTTIDQHRKEFDNPITSHYYIATFLILLDNLGMFFYYHFNNKKKSLMVA